MNSTDASAGTQSQSPYQVDSRKEVIILLKSLQEQRQPLTMIINEGRDIIITALLEVDEENNTILLDRASTEALNRQVLAAPRAHFEASLHRISIQFSAAGISMDSYMGSPALRCAIPSSLIRLQRREYYRISTPVTNPIICILNVPEKNGGGTVKLPLLDISCGGIVVMDDKKVLNADFGTMYENSKLDLPGVGLVDVTLQVRNSLNLVLMNHKDSRRIGFQFINLSNPVMAQIQKLITRIERERNAKQSGLK